MDSTQETHHIRCSQAPHNKDHCLAQRTVQAIKQIIQGCQMGIRMIVWDG